MSCLEVGFSNHQHSSLNLKRLFMWFALVSMVHGFYAFVLFCTERRGGNERVNAIINVWVQSQHATVH